MGGKSGVPSSFLWVDGSTIHWMTIGFKGRMWRRKWRFKFLICCTCFLYGKDKQRYPSGCVYRNQCSWERRDLEISGPKDIRRWRAELAKGEPQQVQRRELRMPFQRMPRAEEKEPTMQGKQRGERRCLIRQQWKGEFWRKGKCWTVSHNPKVKEYKD